MIRSWQLGMATIGSIADFTRAPRVVPRLRQVIVDDLHCPEVVCWSFDLLSFSG